MNKENLLLDSNTIMYLLNGDLEVNKITNNQTLSISFVTEIELLGWHSLTLKEKDHINQFINECYYYDYSGALKNRVIDLRINYRLKLGDSFIAATALEYDLTLVSADKVFTKIKDLQLINFTPSITN